MWHAEPVQWVLRYFVPGKGFGTDPYESVCSLFTCQDVGILFGLHGTMTRTIWRELYAKLKELGVADVMIIRHGERVWYETTTGGVVARRVVRAPGDPRHCVSPSP